MRLIALDIDGTLLDSRWGVPAANCAAIAEAARRGIEVALVTGRRYDFALPVARLVDAPLTMIVNNGALIRTHDGQTHLRHLLARDTAHKVLQATQAWRAATSVVFDRPRANQILTEGLDEDDPYRRAYYARNREFLGRAVPLESCLVEDPLQVMLAGGLAPMRDAEAVLRGLPLAREFSLAVTVYEDKNFSMLDVINPACSKGNALAEWAGVRGYAREEILAIGDNHNDLEMLRFAGIAVVMGNSVPELKSFGWHQTLSNDEAGVAAAISRFALGEAAGCA
ncbi:MAG: HAD-IIB family hydrolase [Acidobacteriia bacterium]|nr:HAD-IIB family hydrolase [Terriglobia bacterium]